MCIFNGLAVLVVRTTTCFDKFLGPPAPFCVVARRHLRAGREDLRRRQRRRTRYHRPGRVADTGLIGYEKTDRRFPVLKKKIRPSSLFLLVIAPSVGGGWRPPRSGAAGGASGAGPCPGPPGRRRRRHHRLPHLGRLRETLEREPSQQ